jgi:hypothetical protein
MTNATTAAATATVTTCLGGYLVTHARGRWDQPARRSMGAVSRMVSVVVVCVSMGGGFTVAVAELPLPGLLWLKILFLVLALVGPWAALWGVIQAQRSRLNENFGNPRAAQSLLHLWLTAQIGGD